MFNPCDRAISRRHFLNAGAAGALGASVSGWFDALAAQAAVQTTKGKSCILLWLDGGPSQAHTFDLKQPCKAFGYDYGEGAKPANTSVPGIVITEHLPKLAKVMGHLALVRGMTSPIADHGLATYLMRTGYPEGFAGVSYPSMGA